MTAERIEAQDIPAVKAEDISVTFGRQRVLKGVGMELARGEILGVLGPSGSGKTTLIRCILGMCGADSGRVYMLGRKVPCLEVMDKVGYMAQTDALYDDLSGLENLIFFARLSGMGRREAKARASELFELVGLKDDMAKRVVHYSGGMKRRLSLMAALISDPELLILDEPTVGIDPVLREVFWEEFRRRRARGRAVIVTTHVMDEAGRCDRLMLLREGVVMACGAPDRLMRETGLNTIEEVFLHYSRASSAPKEAGR
jgi:ABC-2 type transport system ATP-binding protein